MIDLHTHILHGFDDGARSWEESLELCRMAAAGGTTAMAATPHGPGSTASRLYNAKLIAERAAQLEQALNNEGITFRIIAGTEISYDLRAIDALRHSLVIPYANTHTVLLEPTYGFVPTFEQTIFELQALGYRIVLAHPERLADVQEQPNTLVPLIKRGVLMQLTAEALTGQQGSRMQRVAETLVRRRMIHILATDTHRTNLRSPLLGPARNRAAALIGTEAADALVTITPAALLANQPIQLPQPITAEPRSGWFGRS